MYRCRQQPFRETYCHLPSSCQLRLFQPLQMAGELFCQRRQCSHCSAHVEQLLVEPLQCTEVRQGLNVTRRYMLIHWLNNPPFGLDCSLYQSVKCHGLHLYKEIQLLMAGFFCIVSQIFFFYNNPF